MNEISELNELNRLDVKRASIDDDRFLDEVFKVKENKMITDIETSWEKYDRLTPVAKMNVIEDRCGGHIWGTEKVKKIIGEWAGDLKELTKKLTEEYESDLSESFLDNPL